MDRDEFLLMTDRPPIRLLLVDDDEMMHDLVRAVLGRDTRRKWEVHCARDVPSAMKIANDIHRIGVAAIDYHLGDGMTGLDLMPMLRRIVGEDTAMVVLTGYAESPRIEEVNAAGGVAIIPKGRDTVSDLEGRLLEAIDVYMVAHSMLAHRRRSDDKVWERMEQLIEVTSRLVTAVEAMAYRRKTPFEVVVDGIRYAAKNPSTAAVVLGFVSTVILVLQSAGVLPTIATLLTKGGP